VPPSYPDSAIQAGIQGTVVVLALVCACGGIQRVQMASSIPGLDGAAMDAIRQWIFSPGLVNGEPVAVWVAIPVRFTLHAPADGPTAGAPEVLLGAERALLLRAPAEHAPSR
jgi:TonB family protein